MGMGYNKLIEEHKARMAHTKDKMKFVLQTLSNKEAQFTMMAYNGLKQRKQMLEGVGMGDAEMKKVQLIKRLTNQGYNLQCQAVNALKEFIKSERLEHERQQKEKDRILRRVCDSNLRLQGQAYRQLHQHMEAEVEKERQLMFKQRGIMRRICDDQTRLMGMGYNKLIEEWKASQNTTKEKMKFVISTLSNKEAQFTMMAYNALKQRKQ